MAKRDKGNGKQPSRRGRPARSKGTSQGSVCEETIGASHRSGSARQQGGGGGKSMNAIAMLKADHRKVEELFREYEAVGDQANRKRDIAEQVFMELDTHSKLEEEIFYPAVQAMDEEGKELVDESINAHQEVKDLIEELRGMNPEDEEYEEKFKTLVENVKHHVEEEEGKMFPDAQEKLGEEEIERLGAEMEGRKDQIMAVQYAK